MTDYKATPAQWDDLEQWAKAGSNASTDYCILELLSRVTALEKVQKPTSNLNKVRSSLVERVQAAINKEYKNSLGCNNLEAVAAINEVFKWLQEEMWPEIIKQLEQ
jgi:predicted transcriptional regulator